MRHERTSLQAIRGPPKSTGRHDTSPGKGQAVMPKNAKQYISEVEEMWDTAEREGGRSLTVSERTRMEGLLEQAKAQRDLERQIKEMDPGAPLLARMGAGGAMGGGPGDRFVASKAYQQVRSGERGQTWSTGPPGVGRADGPEGHAARVGGRRPGRWARTAAVPGRDRLEAVRASRRA
jgi:hypothetical protein